MFNIICMDELKDMAFNNKRKMLNKFKKVSNNYGVETFVVKDMKPITMDKLNIESYFYKAKNFYNNDYKLSFENTMQYQFTDIIEGYNKINFTCSPIIFNVIDEKNKNYIAVPYDTFDNVDSEYNIMRIFDMMFNHLKNESFEQLDTQYLLDSMEPIEIEIQHNTLSFEERVNKARNAVLKELNNE